VVGWISGAIGIKGGALEASGRSLDFEALSSIVACMKPFAERALDALFKHPCAYALMALGFVLETLVELPFRIAMCIDALGRFVERHRRG
jgi:hypothetical protein